jgi:hypothetical protein
VQTHSQRGGFPAFLKSAVAPHTGKQIHVVLDNLSTHTTSDIIAWLQKNQHVCNTAHDTADPATNPQMLTLLVPTERRP